MPTMPWVLHRSSFSFRVEPANNFICHMLVYVMVCAFCFQDPMWILYSPLGFATLQPSRLYPWQAYVPSGDGLWPTPEVHWVVGSSLLLIELSPIHSSYMVGHTGLGAWQSHLISPASLHGREGFSIPDSALPDDTVDSKSVVGLNLMTLVLL